MGKTVDELLCGHPTPITTTELRYWDAYRKVKAEYQKEADERATAAAEKNNNSGEPIYITMGQKT